MWLQRWLRPRGKSSEPSSEGPRQDWVGGQTAGRGATVQVSESVQRKMSGGNIGSWERGRQRPGEESWGGREDVECAQMVKSGLQD